MEASSADADAHYVKMQRDDATVAVAPQRPRLPARAASERVRSAPAAPLRATGSVRALVRLMSVQEETSQPTTTAPAASPRRLTSGGSLTDRSSQRMQSIRRGLGAPTSVAPLMRAVSSMLRLNATPEPPVEETFRCHICFDDVGVSEAVTLASCGHKYCLSCFKPYLELKITEGNVYPVCFHPPYLEIVPSNGNAVTNSACGVAIGPDQIKQIVDPEVFTKYEYFRFNKEHQHARECPYCSHSQDCAGPENPVCICVQCEKSFCFFHGNAHENGTCADYELKNAQEESLNRAKIDEISKPCPGCHRDVEKNGGCNHMKCIGCNTSFCWLCGEIIEDTPTPSHYADGAGSCSGMQFDGMEATPPTWQQWLIIVFFTLLTVPPAFVLSLVLTPLLWPCNRSKGIFELFFETQGVIIVVLCAIIGLVLAPVGWAIDICIALITFIVVLLYELLKLCFCCCRSTQSPSEPAHTEIQGSNDLEAGLVPVDEPKTEDSPATVHAGGA